MNIVQAEAWLKSIIPALRAEFYSDTPWELAGCPMGPYVDQDLGDRGHLPNGNATMVDRNGATYGGVAVNGASMQRLSDQSFKFFLCHEIGHTMAPELLKRLGIGGGASSAMDEIFADLMATYTLVQYDMYDTVIRATVNNAVAGNLFDQGWSGHHPPAAIRAEHVNRFLDMLVNGNSWSKAMGAVCNSSIGLGTSRTVTTIQPTPTPDYIS